jgi:O-acetyl-ADP-ribose deacetylase (regulator of RNase III)
MSARAGWEENQDAGFTSTPKRANESRQQDNPSPVTSFQGIAIVMDATEKIVLMKGDLTEMDADAIVNAANNDLQHGGGVAGAIRRKGGDAIQSESNAIGSIPVGGAAITSGGNLKARYVIHAASMQLGGRTTPHALRSSTAHSLRIAAQKGLKTIAFPAVGTGIAGFPMKECAEIMLAEVVEHLRQKTSLERVYFVLFDEEGLKIFRKTWRNMRNRNLSRRASTSNLTAKKK